MRVRLESTDRVVEVILDGGRVPGRVWQGQTESGIEVVAVVTRIASRLEADQSQFEAELHSCAPPGLAATEAFPLRMVL